MCNGKFKLFEDDSDEIVFRAEIMAQMDLKRSENLLEFWLQEELKIQTSEKIMVQIYDVSDKLPINYNPWG